MNIKINEYTIKPNGFGNYDLHKNVVSTNKTTKEEYDSENVIAYGCSMEGCVSRIVYENVLGKEETVDIKTFLNEYKKEVNRINEMINLNMK